MFKAEVGFLIKRVDHEVSEVVCRRHAKLHPKLFVVYDAECRLVETGIDMIKLEIGNWSRLTQIIHRIHNFIDIKESPSREQLVICLHNSLCGNAEEDVVLIRKGGEIGMQGKAKRKNTGTLIVYFISDR